MLSGLQATVTGDTLRRTLETIQEQKKGVVAEERSLMSALHIFTKKITQAGGWSEADRIAVETMIRTAQEIEQRAASPLKAMIWVNEPAARCSARVAGRRQPADAQIKPSEFYKLEELHCEMFARMVPRGTEVATFMDCTQHRVSGIIKELCKWIRCLMIEGSSSRRQREAFSYITILVSHKTILHLY